MIWLGRDEDGQQGEDDDEGDHGAVGLGSALQRISVPAPGRELINLMGPLIVSMGPRAPAGTA